MPINSNFSAAVIRVPSVSEDDLNGRFLSVRFKRNPITSSCYEIVTHMYGYADKRQDGSMRLGSANIGQHEPLGQVDRPHVYSFTMGSEGFRGGDAFSQVYNSRDLLSESPTPSPIFERRLI